MNLLLIAYECSPYRGSEWAAGWGRVLQSARVATVHCIVSGQNYIELLRAREEGLVPLNVHIHTPEPDSKLLRLERKHGHFDYNYAAYRHWHRLAYALAQQLHSKHGFHVAHQSTVCTFREPGYLAELGIPFLWGPFGGTQNFPTGMLGMLPPKEAAKELARTVANTLALRAGVRVRRAAGQASVILGANSTTERHMQRAFPHARVQRLLETGLKEVQEPDRRRWQSRVDDKEQGRAPRPLRILWSGQLRSRKALPVLLEALVSLKDEVRFELDVLGEGPMLAWYQRMAAKIAGGNTVRFLGLLHFEQAVQHMRNADLFCFTSLRDTSGNVVLEAEAAGVPVICFDHQGAHDMVDAAGGIRIPVTTPAQAVRDWADAIRALANDPHRLLALSHGATAKARQFLWSANGDRINDLYRQLASQAVHHSGTAHPISNDAVVFTPLEEANSAAGL